jgi:hypothetical protein
MILKEGNLYSHKTKKGVKMVVYNRPSGSIRLLKKKYRIANGKYLLMRGTWSIVDSRI